MAGLMTGTAEAGERSKLPHPEMQVKLSVCFAETGIYWDLVALPSMTVVHESGLVRVS